MTSLTFLRYAGAPHYVAFAAEAGAGCRAHGVACYRLATCRLPLQWQANVTLADMHGAGCRLEGTRAAEHGAAHPATLFWSADQLTQALQHDLRDFPGSACELSFMCEGPRGCAQCRSVQLNCPHRTPWANNDRTQQGPSGRDATVQARPTGRPQRPSSHVPHASQCCAQAR